MTESSLADVCAVIVSYHPEPSAISSLVDKAAMQVGAVVLVDNASVGDWQSALAESVSHRGGALLAQPHNLGLAAAQNIGIAWARSHGYRHSSRRPAS